MVLEKMRSRKGKACGGAKHQVMPVAAALVVALAGLSQEGKAQAGWRWVQANACPPATTTLGIAAYDAANDRPMWLGAYIPIPGGQGTMFATRWQGLDMTSRQWSQSADDATPWHYASWPGCNCTGPSWSDLWGFSYYFGMYQY